MANKEETFETLCKLVTKVGEEVFGSLVSHDCFCEKGPHFLSPICVNNKVLEFIEQAVEEKICTVGSMELHKMVMNE